MPSEQGKGKKVEGTGTMDSESSPVQKELSNAVLDEEDERRRGREKDRAKDREREREREKEKRLKKKEMSVALKQTWTPPPMPSTEATSGKKKEKDKPTTSRTAAKKEHERARSTKGNPQALTAYSPFSFPPYREPVEVGRRHARLQHADPALERERARVAGEHAKDQVLAHRERDREHARQTEQWSSSMMGQEGQELQQVSTPTFLVSTVNWVGLEQERGP